MNIFYLDEDPKTAAEYLYDTHVVKMPLETAQLLCNAFKEAPYKKTHYNNRFSIWVRNSLENFQWAVQHGLAICEEYTFRYGKVHKSQSVIEWCSKHVNQVDFPETGFEQPPQCVYEFAKRESTVDAYRIQYVFGKSDLKKYTKRSEPFWYSDNLL